MGGTSQGKIEDGSDPFAIRPGDNQESTFAPASLAAHFSKLTSRA
jgi:hypothetical protein